MSLREYHQSLEENPELKQKLEEYLAQRTPLEQKEIIEALNLAPSVADNIGISFLDAIINVLVGQILYPCLDEVAKTILLSYKDDNYPILRDLLNALLFNGEDRIVSLSLLNTDSLKRFIAGKSSKLDIFIEIREDFNNIKSCNIEIQINACTGLTSRMVYLATKNHSDQVVAGQAYNTINPSIAIWIVPFQFSPKNECVATYRFREDTTNEVLSDDVIIKVFQFNVAPTNTKNKANTTNTPNTANEANATYPINKKLANWRNFFKAKTEAELRAIEKEGGVMENAVSVLRGLSQNSRFRYNFFSEVKAEILHSISIDKSYDKGMKEGKAEGIKEGETKGKAEVAYTILELKNLLTNVKYDDFINIVSSLGLASASKVAEKAKTISNIQDIWDYIDGLKSAVK